MREIDPAPTDRTAFIGIARSGPFDSPTAVESYSEFELTFGGAQLGSGLAPAVRDFYLNGGSHAVIVRVKAAPGEDPAAAVVGDATMGTGMQALDGEGLFNLLVIPPYAPTAPSTGDAYFGLVAPAAVALCERRRAILLLDPPADWATASQARDGYAAVFGAPSANAALYFPRVVKTGVISGAVGAHAPSGAVAGVIARTDARRGVWRAPAGMDAVLEGVTGLTVSLSGPESAELNRLGINCLRMLDGRPVVWGARTRRGDDRLADDWKYLPVRRMALFIEESIATGTQWAVFEPNGEALWSSLRRSVESFLFDLYRQGALQGARPEAAYFVRCDRSTMTQDDLDNGVVILMLGVALLKPAEFLIFRIMQRTADTV